MEKREAKTRQCSTTERNLLYGFWWLRSQDLWQQPCRAKGKLGLAPRRWLQNRKLHPKRFPKRFMAVKWNLMNPQGDEWNLCNPKLTKITVHAKDMFAKHEDRIACKGFTSMTHYLQFGSQIYSYASINEDPGCRSSSGQGMEKARVNPSMANGESQEQEGGYSRSTKRQKKVHWWHMSPQKNAELEPELQTYKGRVVLRGDIVKDDCLRPKWLPQE